MKNNFSMHLAARAREHHRCRNLRTFRCSKFFCFPQCDENFLCENCLPVLTYTANIWCAFDIDENIVTRKFLTKSLRTKLMRITAYICFC